MRVRVYVSGSAKKAILYKKGPKKSKNMVTSEKNLKRCEVRKMAFLKGQKKFETQYVSYKNDNFQRVEKIGTPVRLESGIYKL